VQPSSEGFSIAQKGTAETAELRRLQLSSEGAGQLFGHSVAQVGSSIAQKGAA
jgi:hypothetical protein